MKRSEVIELSSDEESCSSKKLVATKGAKKCSITDYFQSVNQFGRKRLKSINDNPQDEDSNSVILCEQSCDPPRPVSSEVNEEPSVQADNDIKVDSPYYLKNFWVIVDSIVGSPGQAAIAKTAFSPSDLELISQLRSLSSDCQKMFVRLFQRNKTWFPRGKISYEREFSGSSVNGRVVNASDVLLTKLVASGLLLDQKKVSSIFDIVDLLRAEQVKTYSTKCGLFPHNTSSKFFSTKASLISHIEKMSTNLSPAVWQKTESKLIGKCVEIVGACYSVPDEVKNVFLRPFLMFAMICDLTFTQGQSNSGTSSLLSQTFSLLEVDRGLRKFPTFELGNSEGTLDCVYESPEEVDLALWFYSKSEQITNLLTSKKVDEALQLAVILEEKYQSKFVNSKAYVTRMEALSALPGFIKRMAVPSLAKRALFSCSEAYERGKKYDRALKVFKLILETCVDFSRSLYRKVWPRIVLDQSRHLKDPATALKTALTALEDKSLSLAARLALEDRIESDLWKRVNGRNSGESFVRKLVLIKATERTITAPQISYEFDKHKTKFYRMIQRVEDDDSAVISGDTVEQQVTRKVTDGYELCSVEETAMDYYLAGNAGEVFSEGLHAEGSSVCSLMCLLFWDIFFRQPDDYPHSVFLSRFQSAPLDLYGGKEFYRIRQKAIDERLSFIESASDEISGVTEMVSAIWEEHVGEHVHPISWTIFTDCNQVCRLIRAIGGRRLASLMRILVTDFAFFHSGFPDLTIWDANCGNVRFVEVKGPGDSLSEKQRIWLDRLKQEDIPAEVCYVEGVKSKRLSSN